MEEDSPKDELLQARQDFETSFLFPNVFFASFCGEAWNALFLYPRVSVAVRQKDSRIRINLIQSLFIILTGNGVLFHK
jgi:hypothetical protein